MLKRDATKLVQQKGMPANCLYDLDGKVRLIILDECQYTRNYLA
jgi:hypothetical protein